MELQKEHGTIKKLRTGAVVSTLALTAFGVSTGVSASETEVAVNEPATRVVAKDEVVPKVPSQADVDKANQDVAKQKEVVSTTEANIANAEKTIADTTKKVEEAKTVTPEKVAEAKADAEKKANELATAEKTVADADKSVSTTAEKVEDQTKVVSNAEKTATATANKVADAQKKVDSLSSTTTDVAPLEKEVAKLTDQVKSDTQDVGTAQTNLDNGKKAQSNREQAIRDAQTGVSQAETNLSQATTALANAKADQTSKDKAVTTAQADLGRAKEELANTDIAVNTITLSQEYMSLLKEYLTTGKPEALSQKLKEQGIKELQKAGKVTLTKDGEIYRFDLPFNSTKKDQNTKVDVNNLDYETRKDLSLFAADLFNQVRKQFGTGLVSVNEDAMAIADKVAKLTKGIEYHDTKTLNSVGKEYGVLLAELIGNDTHKLTTVSEIKKAIYNDVYAMLYWDTHADWGHAQGVSHVADEPFMSYHQYLGISTSYDENTDTKIHYLGTSDNVTSYGAKFDKTKVVIAPSTAEKVAKLQEKLDLAQSTYDDAVKASQEAKTAVQSAQTDYTNAETALANARTHLSDLVGNKIDVPALEKVLTDAKDKLAQDSKAWQTAKEVLALAKSNATDKVKALAEAKTALETAKAEQSNADQSLETAKGELEVLTKAHDVAVLARKSAGADLARKREASKEASDTYEVLALSLTERDKVLKTLDKELTDAKSKLGVLRAELETAKDELARLEGIAEAKARILANLKDLKDRYETEQAEKRRLEELSRKADAIRNAGGQPKEVTDADGKVIDIVDAKVQNKPVNVMDAKAKDKAVVATVGTKDDKTYQAPAQATNTKVEPKKQLPNTGTKDSGLLALLGASVGLFALAGKRKYNR